MRPPRLPTRTGDAWACSFLFDSVHDVRAVSCRGGLVVAGGAELHVLRPGAQTMSSRAPPLDIGPIRVAAAEPRAPWRYAVASEELVAVFYRHEQSDQLMRLRCTPPGPSATHLAWARAGGSSALYIRWNDGVIVRLKQDMSGIDTTDLPPMDAIAADSEGALAMISFDLPTPRAYVTRDGENLEFRPLPDGYTAGPSRHVHLAVADTAVAFAVEDGGAFVSRKEETPFLPAEPLATAGPLEFQGASSDAALFGATCVGGVTSIIRVDQEGAAVRIADFGSEGAASPTFTELSWDASRQRLWAASPQVGIVTCTEPSAKGGKKGMVS